jgi:4-aminobutyrate aminotransferase-like enzyme
VQLAAAAEDAAHALDLLEQRGFAPAAFYLDTASRATASSIRRPRGSPKSQRGCAPPGALIVADEVQYGLGRCGSHFWGFERRGLTPDIVTLGKPVGNGFPLGVVISSREKIEEFQASCGFFSTFGGNAVAAAAGLAVLQVLTASNFNATPKRPAATCASTARSARAAHPALGQVRGAGLLLGLEILSAPGPGPANARAKRIVNRLCSQHGVLTGLEGPHGNVLKLRPPLTFRRQHADLLVEAIDASLSAEPTAEGR